MLVMMLDDEARGSSEWHMAHMSLLCRSAEDVYCPQVLQHTAEDLSLISLPEATHTCIKSQKFLPANAYAFQDAQGNFADQFIPASTVLNFNPLGGCVSLNLHTE